MTSITSALRIASRISSQCAKAIRVMAMRAINAIVVLALILPNGSVQASPSESTETRAVSSRYSQWRTQSEESITGITESILANNRHNSAFSDSLASPLTVGDKLNHQLLTSPALTATYVITTSRIGRTFDLTAANPQYINITGSITGEIRDMALDPFDENNAWVATTTGIWRSSNLLETNPTWTQILTGSQIKSSIPAASGWAFLDVSRVVASPTTPGLFFVRANFSSAPSCCSNDYVGHTHNNGASWTWSAGAMSVGNNNRLGSLAVGPGNVVAIGGATSAGNEGKLWLSTDGGHSFTAVYASGFNSWHAPVNVFIPSNNNPGSQVIYLLDENISHPYPNPKLLRSVNRGQSWQIITPTGWSNYGYRDLVNVRRIGTPTNNRQLLFVSDGRRYYYSADGGDSFEQRSYFGAADSNDSHAVSSSDAQVVSRITQTDILLSLDGGYTWTSKLGDWASVMGSSFSQGVTVVMPPLSIGPSLPASQAFATNECPFCNNGAKVYSVGFGVNTYSGNYNQQGTDGELAGAGVPLSFQRSYNSLTSGANSNFPTYKDVLGYGWTHNYNVRLILFGDSGGEAGIAKLIAPRGSVMQFADNGDGTYTPFPAVLATLIRTGSSGNYEYHAVTNSQYEYVFNNSKQLVSIIDPQGHQTTLTYTDSQLTQVQDASGSRRLKFYYSDGWIDHISYVNVAGGNETIIGTSSYSYTSDPLDPNGKNLTSVTDFNGRIWSYTYSGSVPHLLTKVIDPSGKTLVETNFDTTGRALWQKDGMGKLITEILSYAGDERQIRTDGNNPSIVTTVSFSGGVPTTVDGPGYGDSQTSFSGYGINPATLTDPNGNATELTWGLDGRNLTQIEDALENTTELEYDGLNNLVTVTDDLGRITRYEYFSGTTLIQRTIANYQDGNYDSYVPNEDLITSFTYTDGTTDEPSGLVRTQTGPHGVVTYYTYTPQGQRATVTLNYVDGTAGPDDEDLLTSYTYDDRGRVLTITDPAGRVSKNEYDSEGNIFRVTRNFLNGQPQNYQNTYNLITGYEYDEVGRLVKSTDTLNHISYTCYDYAGRAVKTIQNPSVLPPAVNICQVYSVSSDPALDRITTTTYDDSGNMVATTGPDGIVSRTYYDDLRRPIATIQNLTVAIATTLENVPAWSSANPDQNIRSLTEYDPAGNVLRTIDNVGAVTHYCYDALNRVVKTVANPTVADPCQEYSPGSYADADLITSTVYDDVGNAIATIDLTYTSADLPYGRITRTYYDPLNRPYLVIRNWYLSTTSDPRDLTLLTYDSTHPDRNLGTLTYYDSAGRAYRTVELPLIAVHPDITGDWTCYDEAGRVVKSVRNAVSTNPCDSGYTPSTEPDRDLIVSYQYDSTGQQILVTAPDGKQTRTFYDAAGRRIAVTQNFTGNINDTEPPAFDSQHPDENVTTRYEYDPLGRVYKTVSAAGSSQEWADWMCYDALGRATRTVQNASGDGSTPQTNPCDAANYQASTSPSADIITTLAYDAKGDAIATTDTEEAVTRTYYDALHRPRYVVANLSGQLITDPAPPAYDSDFPDQNARQETRYDDAGQPFETVDNTGLVTHTNYDLLGRPLEVIVNYVDGQPSDSQTNLVSRTVYNRAGQATDVQDANGIVTHFDYDGLGDLVKVIENYLPVAEPDPVTNDIKIETRYEYDWRGNRLKIIDANQHETAFSYDAVGRLETETDALNHVTTHRYDKAGLERGLTDANHAGTSTETVYDYDGLRRLMTIDYPDATGDVAFEYDAAGNRVEMSDGAGTTTWTPDDLARPLSIAQPGSAVIGYTYDAIGNRKSLTYADGKVVNYDYDELNRLELVTPSGTGDWGAAGDTNYRYNDFGAIDLVTLPNGVTATYDYDAAHRLKKIAYKLGEQVLSYFDYTLDAVGNRQQVVEYVVMPAATTVTATTTATASPTETGTITPTGTIELTITPTATGSNEPTQTPTATASDTPTPTGTPHLSTATSTETETATPSLTPTATATDTPETATNTPTATETSTPAAAPTDTLTATFTPTDLPTPTPTPTETEIGGSSPQRPVLARYVPPKGRLAHPVMKALFETTGFLSPNANAAATGGDGNGYQTNPTNAYSDNATFAVDTDSGSNTNTSCTNSGKDKHNFYDYSISVPAGAAIDGIEVRLDAKADSTTGAPKMCVRLSWNGGSSWTTTSAAYTATLSTTEATYTLGGAADTWGRSWTTSQLSNANFRVQVIDVASNISRDFSLDWVAVQVHYTPPTATPTPTATFTATPTPTLTPTPSNTPTPFPPGSGIGLNAEYFDNADLSGSPAFVRIDPDLELDWGSGSPNPLLGADDHSVRWTGQIQPRTSGLYEFELDADGGVRLTIDSQLIIDDWQDPDDFLDRYGQIQLQAGQLYEIELEYFDEVGESRIALYWWDETGLLDEYVPSSQLYPASTPPTSTPSPTITPTPTATFTSTITPTPTLVSVVLDEFDGPTLEPDWDWYIPKSGPTYSLTGYFTFSLPAYNSFVTYPPDHNEAPQLRRFDLGDGDWNIETRLWGYDPRGGSNFWNALEIGFGDYDQILYGLHENPTPVLTVERSGEDPIVVGNFNPAIYLRVERRGNHYSFLYRGNPANPWIEAYADDFAGTPLYVGLTTQIVSTSNQPAVGLWEYFRLERFGDLTFTPTNTPTITPTPTDTETPTITSTPTDTRTPTHTPTPTNTYTPTFTPTPALLPPGDGTGLAGEYYDDLSLVGAPLYVRLDPQVQFMDWGEDSPVPGVVFRDFAVRWTGQVQARSSENYIFRISGDDQVRLWIDGTFYTDWVGSYDTPAIALVRGQKYDVQIEFRDTGGNASVSFRWGTISGTIGEQPVPMAQLFPPAGGLPATATATPTVTNTPTKTPTVTRTPTNTFTPTSTKTYTFTPTVTNTPTDTFTPTNTQTPTSTNTPLNMRTPTPTKTPPSQPTERPGPTNTLVPNATPTPTDLPPTPTPPPVISLVTITYTYDKLYRLTAAEYSDGRYFYYKYDAVGNRLEERKCRNSGGCTELTETITTYVYDAANRLTNVNGQSYTWDDNGNLLDDWQNTYTYDAANRLTSFTDGTHTSTYTYSGLGDRLSQTVDSVTTDYVLDLNTGLTQVLDDGTNTYLYGNGRIGELQPGGFAYHLGDALGSVRQLTDADAEVTLARSFEPFGSTLTSAGNGSTVMSFTGEAFDSYIKLIYLRSRWLNTDTGRFTSKDTFRDYSRPLTLNGWGYVEGDPINRVDPSGMISSSEAKQADKIISDLASIYNVKIIKDWGWVTVNEYIPSASPSLYETGTYVCYQEWQGGAWRNVKELEIVRDAIDMISAKMGNAAKFRSAYQTTSNIARWGDLPNSPAFTPPYGTSSVLGDVVLPDYHFNSSEAYAKFNVIHEFGHLWDFREGEQLSAGLQERLGTERCTKDPRTGKEICVFDIKAGKEVPPGNPDITKVYAGTSAWEDWAEAFATYVYPAYYGSTAANKKLGPMRRQYVLDQINAIP